MNFNTLGNNLTNIASYFNNSKYFYGLMMIFLNIGSKYLTLDISAPFHKVILSSKIMRRFCIFTIVFIATKDIMISLIITAVFIIFALNLFNDKSKYCILPQSFKNLDTNIDGLISPKEIENAYNKLKEKGKLPSQLNKK
tara:strand:+ start:970 stop:1389 length:420 start_codon:yes stop_codon:yes gene_type:complete